MSIFEGLQRVFNKPNQIEPEEFENFEKTFPNHRDTVSEDSPEMVTEKLKVPISIVKGSKLDDPYDQITVNIAGVQFGIEYQDANNQISRRWISATKLKSNYGRAKTWQYISGYCYTRKAPRLFSIDGIKAVFDENGEISDPLTYIASLEPITTEPQENMRPGALQRKAALPGIRLLVAMARADGRKHPSELEVIADYAEDRAFENGIQTSEEDRTALMTYLHNIYPRYETVRRDIVKLQKEPTHLQKLLTNYAIKVMNADGIQHADEFTFMLEIQESLQVQ